MLRESEKEYSAHQQRQKQNGTWEKAQSFASAISYARQRSFLPTLPVALKASHQGVMSQRALYEWILSSELAVEHVGKLGTLAGAFHSTGQRYSSRVFIYHMGERETSECLRKYIGKEKPETSEDLAMLQYADEVLTPLLRRVIDEELKRGDTTTPYTKWLTMEHKSIVSKNFCHIDMDTALDHGISSEAGMCCADTHCSQCTSP